VAYLFRYREISLQANAPQPRCPAAVDHPTPGKQALQRLTTTKDAAGFLPFNPLAELDTTLFKSLMAPARLTYRAIRSLAAVPQVTADRAPLRKAQHLRALRVRFHGPAHAVEFRAQ
jgi:hypothetical protein